MSELHNNVFFYYGLPRRAGTIKKQTQLENNVTKALLNTLSLCPGLRRLFLQWLRDRFELSIDPTVTSYLAVLGNPDDDERKMSERILLGIKKHSRDYRKALSEGTKQFDGKIVGEDWLIVIESKLGGMNMCQFEAEEEEIVATRSIQVLWSEIDEYFGELIELRASELDQADRLFIQQFNEYLKIAGLISFPGLQKGHLSFFYRDVSDRDCEGENLGSLMKELLGELWEYEYMDGAQLNNLYWDRDMHIKGLYKQERDYAELSFYYRSRSSSPSVGVVIWPDNDSEHKEGYLEIYAHIEGERRLRRLAGFLEKRGGRGKLTRRLRMDEFIGYRIGLYDNNWNTVIPHEYECSAVTSDELRELASQTREEAGANVHFALTRAFVLGTPRSSGVTQLPTDRKGQLNEIARAIRTLHPFVQFASGVTWDKITW